MNTRKPTKKEVPDDAHCWYWYLAYRATSWELRTGNAVRAMWQRGDYWLPLDAIPDPSIKQTTRSKP